MRKDSTVLNVKIDKELKKQAQKTAKDLGLPISTVVAASLRDFVQTRSLTISDESRLKPEVIKELKKRSKEANDERYLSPSFDTAEDATTWLEKELNI